MCLFWDYISKSTALIDPEHLVSIDLASPCDNVSLPCFGVKRMVFLTLLVAVRMMIWSMRVKGILRYECYYQNLVGFFGQQLRMKIRTARRRLLSADFSERCVKIASLVNVNASSHDFLFLVFLGTTGQFPDAPLLWLSFF